MKKKNKILIITFFVCVLFSTIFCILFYCIPEKDVIYIVEEDFDTEEKDNDIKKDIENDIDLKPIETTFVPQQIEYLPPIMYDYMLEDNKNIITNEIKIQEILTLLNSYNYDYIGLNYQPNYETDGLSCLFIMNNINGNENSFCSVAILNDVIIFNDKAYRVDDRKVNGEFFNILNE